MPPWGFNRWADRRIDAENPRYGRARNTRRQNPGAACAVVRGRQCSALHPSPPRRSTASRPSCRPWRCPSSCLQLLQALHAAGAPRAGAFGGIAPRRGFYRRGRARRRRTVHPRPAGDDLVRRSSSTRCRTPNSDRRHGLHSIPARFSARSALGVSCGLHAVSIAALGWFMTYCPGSVWLWLGAGVFTGLLVLEHLLVTPARQLQYRHRLRDASARPGDSSLAAGVIVDLLK